MVLESSLALFCFNSRVVFHHHTLYVHCRHFRSLCILIRLIHPADYNAGKLSSPYLLLEPVLGLFFYIKYAGVAPSARSGIAAFLFAQLVYRVSCGMGYGRQCSPTEMTAFSSSLPFLPLPPLYRSYTAFLHSHGHLSPPSRVILSLHLAIITLHACSVRTAS